VQRAVGAKSAVCSIAVTGDRAPHPVTLPLAGAPRLTMVDQEVRLEAGATDLLAVESSGRLVTIEVKVAGNGR